MNIEVVKNYYGKVLSSSSDLKTDACCTPNIGPASLKAALAKVHDEVLAKYYGCGLVLPEALEGMRILDLGCGSGRDVYVLSQLVGPDGFVAGVDMTQEQLSVARDHTDWHMAKFGYDHSNVAFHEGYIESLGDLDLEPGSFDIIVSNCVINLSPDKIAVLNGARRLLKPGGEIYFADVYADRRLSEAVRQDPILLGECLGGALYWNDFHRLAAETGFRDPRLVTARPLAVTDGPLKEKLGTAKFVSATYRLFNIDELESDCEDYGQAVIYKGGIAGHEAAFDLDSHHHIERGKVFPVCGNTWRMLEETRFKDYFEFIGNFDTHYGIFEGCGANMPYSFEAGETTGSSASGCC